MIAIKIVCPTEAIKMLISPTFYRTMYIMKQAKIARSKRIYVGSNIKRQMKIMAAKKYASKNRETSTKHTKQRQQRRMRNTADKGTTVIVNYITQC